MLSFFAATSYSKFPILPSTIQHWIPKLSVLSDPLFFRFLHLLFRILKLANCLFFGSDWLFTQYLLLFFIHHNFYHSSQSQLKDFYTKHLDTEKCLFLTFHYFSLPSVKHLLKYNIFPNISVTGREALIPHIHLSICKYYPYTFYIFFLDHDTLCTLHFFICRQCKYSTSWIYTFVFIYMFLLS